MNNSETSTVAEFVLLGFPGCQELQSFLFSLFFGIHIFTIMGNGTIVCAVMLDQRLHTPMYILLGNFAFFEILYVTSMVPRMLANFLSETKAISFVGCFLHYSVSTVQLSQLPFCGPNTIDHFVCDMDPLMALFCAPNLVMEIILYVLSSLIIILTLLYILGSYAFLLIVVLKVPSAAGRQRAFSTCGSHMTVVCLFFGALLAMYVSPTADNPAEVQKILTLFYSVVTPFLNPLIYSL
ncbi:unnamed protein product [Nyctereutes procyonoides]|uniref:(raccoon dog) hypothetical protein n=1 Tax=Nyctereutes procyonoides TaxID=34880 RepID=A0A811XV48_NYCPR|nr:unnamed protein product [Nyctereutes procyonoides]